MSDLLPCPFCNHELDNDDLIDVLYPTGTWWREVNGMRIYFGHDAARHDGDGRCWNIVCAPAACGCGAEMHGDSREEVIEKWNRRALPSAELERDAGRPMKLLGYANPSRIRMTCASKPGGAHLGQVAIYAGESVDPMESHGMENLMWKEDRFP